MKGHDSLFRLRIGNIRIILEKDQTIEKYAVVDIDFRGNIY